MIGSQLKLTKSVLLINKHREAASQVYVKEPQFCYAYSKYHVFLNLCQCSSN